MIKFSYKLDFVIWKAVTCDYLNGDDNKNIVTFDLEEADPYDGFKTGLEYERSNSIWWAGRPDGCTTLVLVRAKTIDQAIRRFYNHSPDPESK